MNNQSAKQKFFNHPITRIILGLLVCFVVFVIGQNIIGKLLESLGLDRNLRNLLKGIISSVFVVYSYRLFYKYTEKREVTEISAKGIVKNLAMGIFLGGILQSVTILVIYVCGGFKVMVINPVSFIIIPLTVAFTVAIFEEILIRGIIFRIMEEKLGSILALSISALIFGALHLANPNSSLISGTCIAIEAGLLLGAAYIYTRNLWFPIAIHFAWNFMQSGIFGAITSGNEKNSSLLTSQITGSKLITGGEFGPEGTIQATLFCLIATIILMYLNKKQNKLIKPYWSKEKLM